MSSSVIVQADLSEFFRDEVNDAQSELGIELGEMIQFYVVNLLCDYSRPGPVASPGEEALALLYKRALEAPPAARVQLLKNLGDLALYASGFFADFIERSLVDIDYYISMGGNAYGNLSGLVGTGRHGDTFAEVYTELSGRFTELVDLLTQIAERSRAKSEDDTVLLKLYDRWARTGSDRIHRLLRERGLVPTPNLPTDYEQ